MINRGRYSDAYNIQKTDINKSVFRRTYEGINEWWIYRKKDSRFVDAVGKLLKTDEQYLYCVIACGDNFGFRQENERFIAVEGYKFAGEDLKEYLNKTGRTDRLLKTPEDDNPNEGETKVYKA